MRKHLKKVVSKRVVSKRVVLADVPPERKPERGCIRMFPRNQIRTTVRSHVPPERKPERGSFAETTLYETALLSPNEIFLSEGVSTGVWCVPGFGAGFEIALEPSVLQKQGDKKRKRALLFSAPNPGMRQTLVQKRSDSLVLRRFLGASIEKVSPFN